MARPNSISGPFPKIALCSAFGLLVCSAANALSRATETTPVALYLAGVLLISLPIFYRLTSQEAPTGERFALVCLLGLALYGAKVVHDVPQFTFFDELIHSYNADQVAGRHELFTANPILEATPSYPGLGGATSALMTITGLSVYPAGLIVIGVARLLLVASLFLLFLRISDSGRIAGLGVALYAGNFNFVFWGAQYAYQSLALPLLVFAMMLLAEREATRTRTLREWGAPALLAIAAVVVTHHLTSYALAAVLAALALAYRSVHRTWEKPNPWPVAVAAALAAVAWLVVVASSTLGYLTPVLSNAFDAVTSTIAGENPPRGVFQGTGAAVPATPFVARAVALLALVALVAALPVGLREFRRRYRKRPFAIVFALAALGFLGTLALRLTPPAWETGNRAAEFLFIGLAFIVACAAAAGLRRWADRRLARPLVGTGVALVLVGGIISGWPWDSQLSRPMRVAADGGTIVSPPLGMAEWAHDRVGDARFAAAVADAGLLLHPGGKVAIAGTSPDVEDVIDGEALEGWELPLLRENDLRYVVADRRQFSGDALRGYFFARRGKAATELKPRSLIAKFNRVPGAARVYTNGSITVFDLRGRR
jgi:hypothetical protein